jgi:putative ABC transport system permease protein
MFLSDVVNRAPIGLFTLLKGALLMLVIGLFTIGSQTVKAAIANPSDTLRNE